MADLEVRDKAGQLITVGSFIVYGHNIDRSAALRFGKVLALKEREKRWHSEGNPITITVIGVEDYGWNNRIALCSRKGSLMYPDRTLVIPRETIPQTHLDLFDSYEALS